MIKNDPKTLWAAVPSPAELLAVSRMTSSLVLGAECYMPRFSERLYNSGSGTHPRRTEKPKMAFWNSSFR